MPSPVTARAQSLEDVLKQKPLRILVGYPAGGGVDIVARLLGGENLISRQEVERLQGLRGMYGIESPAPLCTDPAGAPLSGEQAVCQVLEAPSSATERLVPDVSGMLQKASRDGEIRLTYGELTALIAEAVSNLKD